MDGTVMDLETSILQLIQPKYPEIKEQIANPLSSYFLQTNVVKGWDVLNEIHNPKMYLNEPVYLSSYQLIKDLIRKGYDVWFVTMPNGDYHYQLATSQKIAQITRLFGTQMAQKIVFSAKKYDVKGKYLIDDSKSYLKDMDKASWKQIMVDWRYNQDVEYDTRVSLESIHSEVTQILEQ